MSNIFLIATSLWAPIANAEGSLKLALAAPEPAGVGVSGGFCDVEGAAMGAEGVAIGADGWAGVEGPAFFGVETDELDAAAAGADFGYKYVYVLELIIVK